MPGIGIIPHRSSHHVGMTFDETRHQHRIAEAVVAAEVAPGRRAVGVTDSDDKPVAHSHMCGFRSRGVHRDDL